MTRTILFFSLLVLLSCNVDDEDIGPMLDTETFTYTHLTIGDINGPTFGNYEIWTQELDTPATVTIIYEPENFSIFRENIKQMTIQIPGIGDDSLVITEVFYKDLVLIPTDTTVYFNNIIFQYGNSCYLDRKWEGQRPNINQSLKRFYNLRNL